MAELPPWLNINPTENLIRSAQLGSDIGAKSREMGDQEGQFQQDFALRSAQQNNESQMRLATLTQAAQQQKQETNLRLMAMGQQHQQFTAQLQQSAQQLQLEQEKAAAQDQESKMRLNMEWTQAAKKYQAQQQYAQIYQKLVDSGVDPDKAAMQATMQVGPSALGDSGTGTAGLWRAAQTAQQASAPATSTLTPARTPDGATIPNVFVDSKGAIHDMNRDTTYAQSVSDRSTSTADAEKAKALNTLYASRDRAQANLNKAFTPDAIKTAQAIVDGLNKKIDALEGGGTGGFDDTGTTNLKDPLGLFTK
jgi:hypothetical protein